MPQSGRGEDGGEGENNLSPFCRPATSPILRDPVVFKNHIEVRGRHSDFAAFPASGSRNPYLYIEERERHDVLKRFKGASLYRVSPPFLKNIKDGMCRNATSHLRDI